MPINIYNEETSVNINYLCEDNWSLQHQLYELEKWLKKLQVLPKGKYIIDIGYSPCKDNDENAGGGGFVLTLNSSKKLVDNNIEIYFSVYP